MERDQVIPHEWETKEGLDTLRRMREREQKEKEKKEKEEKEQKDKQADTGGVKAPVQPDKPKVEPLPPEPTGSEKNYWYGYEAVISYKVRGAPCTQTLSGELFGTRSQAEQAMRDASDQALRTGTATRTDLKLESRRLYAGPLPARPTYSGPTGLKAIQCGSAPTPPAVTPTVPTGMYEPKGNGQACPQIGQQTEAQCRQMTEACITRNCSGGGYSGCALDCPGCAGYFGDFTAWCTLHPSYAPMLSSGLSAFLGEIKGCLDQFLADGKAGRRERGTECQGKANKRPAEKKDTGV